MIAYLEGKNTTVEVPDDTGEKELGDIQQNFEKYVQPEQVQSTSVPKQSQIDPNTPTEIPKLPIPTGIPGVNVPRGKLGLPDLPKWVPNFYESYIKPTINAIGPFGLPAQIESLPEEARGPAEAFTTSALKQITAGLATPLLSGVDSEEKDHPVAADAGALTGGLGSLLTAGGALKIAGLGDIAEQAGKAGVEAGIASAQRFLPRAIMTGSTFGTQAFVAHTIKAFQDGDVDLAQFGKDVLTQTAGGATFGAIGGIANIPVSVASAGGLGFIMSKMDGGDNREATLNAGLFAGFEFIGSFGKNKALINEGLKHVEDSIDDYVKAKDPNLNPNGGMGKAIVTLEAQKYGGVEGLAKKENALQLIEDINQKIRQGKVPGPIPTSEAPLPVESAPAETSQQTSNQPTAPNQGLPQETGLAQGSSPGEVFPPTDVSSDPMISNHPDFVQLSNDAKSIVNKYAEERNIAPSNEFAQSLYHELHDVLGEIRRADMKDRPAVIEKIRTEYPDIEREFATLSTKMWSDATDNFFKKQVAGQYGSLRPKVATDAEAQQQARLDAMKQAIGSGAPAGEVFDKTAQAIQSALPKEPKPIKFDDQGLPIRKPGSVVSTIQTADGDMAKITHKMILDEAQGLLKEASDIHATPHPLQEFVRSNGGIKGFKGGMESEEFAKVPIHMRGIVSADEMAQMAYDRNLLEEPSADLLRNELSVIKSKGAKPRLADFYDQAQRNLEEHFSNFKKEELPDWMTENQGGTDEVAAEKRAKYAGMEAPTFYSKLASVVDEKMPAKASSDQVVGLLNNAGVKQEEMDWMGLPEFLKGKQSVTKEELQKFIAENNVQVQEVMKGSENEKLHFLESADDQGRRTWVSNIGRRDAVITEIDPNKFYVRLGSVRISSGAPTLQEAQSLLQDRYEAEGRASGTKFARYTLPGSENYRELLLTLPTDEGLAPGFSVKQNGAGAWEITFPDGRTLGGFGSREDAIMSQRRQPGSKIFESSHFSEPNILAHVRFNDRVDAEGKKVLFLEEVQSDWHQKGREKGYILPEPERQKRIGEVKAAMDKLEADTEHDVALRKDPKINDQYVALWKEYNDLHNVASKVPDAPFKKTWHELALKRMLRYAAENGYDKLAWTTGEQQAARYDLSKQVERIGWARFPDGTYDLTITPKDGSRAISKDKISAQELSDTVGKDLAKHIESDKGEQTQSVERVSIGEVKGPDLKVGGEGMKGFYDKMIPSFLNKYTKKWGGRVGETDISTGNQIRHIPGPEGTFMQGKLEKQPTSEKVPSLDITPSMKESVMEEGQALFERPGDSKQQELNFESPYEEDQGNQVPETPGEAAPSQPAVRSGFRAIQDPHLKVEFQQNGFLIFPNRKIQSPADLAYGFKFLHNEAQENFFIGAIKNDRIVAVEHLAVGTIDQVAVYPYETINMIDRNSADSFFIVHNHPSGAVNPSEQDKRLTNSIQSVMDQNGVKFKGHVIIDDTKFGFIDPDGNVSQVEHASGPKTNRVPIVKKVFEWLRPKSSVGPEVSTPKQAFELFKGIQRGHSEAIAHLMDIRNNVLNSIVIPQNEINAGTLQRLATSYRAAGIILVNSGMVPSKTQTIKNQLDKAQIRLLDDIDLDKDTFRSKVQDGLLYEKGADYNAAPQESLFPEEKENVADRYARLRREAIEQGMNPSQASKWAKDNLAKSKVMSPSEIKLKQTEFGAGGVEGFGQGREGERSLFEMAGTYGENEISQQMKDAATEITNLINPAKSHPLATQITREQLGKMARSYDKAEAALRNARDMFEKQTAEQNTDFIDRMERGLMQTTPALEKIAKQLRILLDEKRTEIRALGTGKLDQFIENYFPHLWDQSEKKVSSTVMKAAKRPFEGSKAFLKKRTVEFFKDGLAMGLTPVSFNPIENVLLKAREMDKYLMAHKTLNAYKENGLAEFVKLGAERPADWIKIDDKISTVTQMTDDGVVIRGHYYAQPDAARIINNYLSPGLQKSEIYQAFRFAGNMLNQFQLGFSLFHLGFTSMDATVSKLALAFNQLSLGHPLKAIKATAQAAMPGYAPISNIIRGDKLFKAWREGGRSPSDEIMAEALASAGGRTQMDQFYATKAFDQVKKYFQAGKPIRGILNIPLALTEWSLKPILEYVVPRQKLGIFSDIMKMEMENNPTMTHEEARSIGQKAWDSVDNRMGQMVYDNLFWNRTFKDLLMASVRSVGWNLGTLRELGGGAFDLTKSMADLARARKPEFTYRMAYLMALPIVVGLYSAIYQYLKTGKGPDELKDYFHPKNGGSDSYGNPTRTDLPSYMKDIFAYTEDPFKTATNKLNPLISIISQMLNNKDYFGTKIRNEDDPITKKALSDAMFILKQLEPFSVRNMQKNAQQGNKTLADKIEPWIGFTPARYDINQTKAERLAHEFQAAHQEIGGRTQEQADRSKLAADFQRRYRQGDPAVQDEMIKAYQQGLISRTQMRNVFVRAKMTPLQKATQHLSFEELKRVYEKATDDEKVQIQRQYDKARFRQVPVQ